jgi:hypothetical protein
MVREGHEFQNDPGYAAGQGRRGKPPKKQKARLPVRETGPLPVNRVD